MLLGGVSEAVDFVQDVALGQYDVVGYMAYTTRSAVHMNDTLRLGLPTIATVLEDQLHKNNIRKTTIYTVSADLFGA